MFRTFFESNYIVIKTTIDYNQPAFNFKTLLYLHLICKLKIVSYSSTTDNFYIQQATQRRPQPNDDNPVLT